MGGGWWRARWAVEGEMGSGRWMGGWRNCIGRHHRSAKITFALIEKKTQTGHTVHGCIGPRDSILNRISIEKEAVLQGRNRLRRGSHSSTIRILHGAATTDRAAAWSR